MDLLSCHVLTAAFRAVLFVRPLAPLSRLASPCLALCRLASPTFFARHKLDHKLSPSTSARGRSERLRAMPPREARPPSPGCLRRCCFCCRCRRAKRGSHPLPRKCCASAGVVFGRICRSCRVACALAAQVLRRAWLLLACLVFAWLYVTTCAHIGAACLPTSSNEAAGNPA